MVDLFVALGVWFDADPISGLVTKLYNTEADDKTAFPYITMSLPSVASDWTFTEEFENILVQFNIFSDDPSPAEVCAIFEALKGDKDAVPQTGLDFRDLSINNFGSVSMTRGPATLLRENRIWQYNVVYELVLEKE